MSDRYCPPPIVGMGGDFPNNYGQPEHGSFNNGYSHESTQNGHFPSRGPGPSMPSFSSEMSPMKPPMYQHGNANFVSHNQPHSQTSSYANVTAPKASYDPFGYRNSTRSTPFHQQQQQRTPPSFTPGTRHYQTATFVEEQHTRPSPNFGGFPPHPTPSNNISGNSTAFGGARVSPHHQQQIPAQFVSNGIPPPFHPSGNQRSYHIQQQQQHFGSIGPSDHQQQVPSAEGNNYNNMMIFSDMNGAGASGPGHPAMMSGIGDGGDFADEFGAAGELNGEQMPAQYVLSNELLGRIDKSLNKQALLELQIGLEQVAFDATPNFNTWAIVIKERMSGRETLPEPDMRIAAEMIVEMSVVLDDSQYNYSRLSQFLCMNIDNFGQNLLLPQVSAFVNETNTFLSPQHLRNLVSFLAELYDKIEIKGVKSSQLAAHLFDQLHNLLKVATPLDDQSINIIVKAMKLTGRFLENDRGPQAMDEFFSELEGNSQTSSDSSKDKIQNLITLRGKKWGIVETSTGASSNNFPSVGIVGPEGEQLTEEEYNFLDESLDNFGNSPSAGSLYNNPMEEDNVEDDYEQFLQATAVQAAEKALEKVSIDEDDESLVSSPKFLMNKQ